MKCSQIQNDLPIYADGVLSEREATVVGEHLESCPVCRAANAEFVEMRSTLRVMGKPDVPAYLNTRIRAAVSSERRAIRRSWLPFPADVREWLVRSVMPYGVATAASLILALGLLFVLNSSAGRYSQFTAPSET